MRADLDEGAIRLDLVDLFPGFACEAIPTRTGRIFARVGGKGPPLLLLHGFPQTHVAWHRLAPRLAESFTVIAADLPGYGQSDVPVTDSEHGPYTKRAMGAAIMDAMHQLGYDRFTLVGHDRGGRVAYRTALDHPQHVTSVAVLDILPTYDYWSRIDRLFALRIYHWAFLAQPYPLPELLIEACPDEYFTRTLQSWAKPGTQPFHPAALAHYLSAMREPSRIHAACEDYRAGAYADYEHDRCDFEAGRKLTTPLLVLWGSSSAAADAGTPLEVWCRRATDVSGSVIDSGHFLPEENPSDTLAALLPFVSERARRGAR